MTTSTFFAGWNFAILEGPPLLGLIPAIAVQTRMFTSIAGWTSICSGSILGTVLGLVVEHGTMLNPHNFPVQFA